MPARHLERMKTRLATTGAGALAAAAVMPPPFPLTAFQLTCGALDFDRRRFFLVFGVMRLVRFAAVALLARHYGSQVLEMLQWHWLQTAGSAVALVGLAATIVTGAVLWSTRVRCLRSASAAHGIAFYLGASRFANAADSSSHTSRGSPAARANIHNRTRSASASSNRKSVESSNRCRR